ncbi:Rv3654c family TadE-like protein [Knoellia sp. S7-12]|uniref:Rv3654c family TadE-like protein n=1 Tax=Knoellia sp. S7-12 TaxID=3126698 RepID=UPI00339068CF
MRRHGLVHARLVPCGVRAAERQRERGSGTVLVVAAIGVLLVLVTGGLHLGAAATAAHRARSAADLAALAGASAIQQGGVDACARRQQWRDATTRRSSSAPWGCASRSPCGCPRPCRADGPACRIEPCRRPQGADRDRPRMHTDAVGLAARGERQPAQKWNARHGIIS